MNRDEIQARVLAALKRVAPEADLTRLPPRAALRDELDIDSMDFLRFLLLLKETTGVEVPEADADKLSTLQGAVGYLAARQDESREVRS